MGLFDGKVFDIFRGDEGDAAAAERRAENREEKAAVDRAIAEAKSPSEDVDPPDESAPVVAPVQVSAGQAAAVVSAAPEWGRAMRALKKARTAVMRLVEAQQKQSEAMGKLAQRQQMTEDRLRKLAKAIIEEEKRKERGAGFLSDGVMSAISGFISVINVSDTVQSPTIKALSESLKALVASDYVEGPTETWVRAGQLLAESIAYYDAQAGLTSIISPESGLVLGTTTSSSSFLTQTGLT